MNEWRSFKAREWVTFAAVLFLCSVAANGARAEVVNLTYTPATQWTDGVSLALSDIRSSRLFCDGVMVAGGGGASGIFSPDLAAGTYICYATHTITLAAFLARNLTRTTCTRLDPLNPDACESTRSNEITEIVGAAVEITVGPPTNLEVQ